MNHLILTVARNLNLILGIVIVSVITFIYLEYEFIILVNIFYILLVIYFIGHTILIIKFNQKLNILEIQKDKNLRCLKFIMVNSYGLSGHSTFRALFNTLMNNQDFINFSFNKIII